MPKPKNNIISLKAIKLPIVIILGFVAIGGMFFASKADIRDTVDAVVAKEIKDDNKFDDGKYFGKSDGVRLQEQYTFIKEKVEKTAEDVEKMSEQMTRQYILLEKISAKLDDYNDSP